MSGHASAATVQPGVPDAAQRQAEAIKVSGWGQSFTFVQPRNLCFWVYVILTVIGVVQIMSYYDPIVGFYGQAFALAALIYGVCGSAWFLWFRHIDRWERQPLGLIVAGIIWGAIPATFAFAMTVNTALLGIYPKLFGQVWSANWAAGLAAPFTEEAAKLCGFLLLMGLAPHLIRTANDGLILGAFIGLGFATFEDFLYSSNAASTAFGVDPSGNAVHMASVRVVFSFASHPLFSALVCAGAVYLIGTRAQPRRIGPGIALVVAGMFLHFTWDDASGLGFGSALATLFVALATVVVGFVILSTAFRRAAPREHQFVRDILAPEIDAGHLRADELESVLTKEGRKAARRAAPHRHARSHQRHLRKAVLDLTHAIASSRGTHDDTAPHARTELIRLRSD